MKETLTDDELDLMTRAMDDPRFLWVFSKWFNTAFNAPLPILGPWTRQEIRQIIGSVVSGDVVVEQVWVRNAVSGSMKARINPSLIKGERHLEAAMRERDRSLVEEGYHLFESKADLPEPPTKAERLMRKSSAADGTP